MNLKVNKEDIEIVTVLVIGIIVWLGINITMIIDKVWTW